MNYTIDAFHPPAEASRIRREALAVIAIERRKPEPQRDPLAIKRALFRLARLDPPKFNEQAPEAKPFLHSTKTVETDFSRPAGRHHEFASAIDDSGRFVQTVQFDHASIDGQLSWTEPEPPAVRARNQRFKDASELLGKICEWIADSATLSSAGLRAIGMAFVLRPRFFKQETMSELASFYNVTKQALTRHSRELRELSHGLFVTPNCQTFSPGLSRAQTEAHRRRGHAIGPEARIQRARERMRARTLAKGKRQRKRRWK